MDPPPRSPGPDIPTSRPFLLLAALGSKIDALPKKYQMILRTQ